ncbi:MAG: PHP domain-containing protein [Chloroflexi bacterium]|nr:PHP domain-containing protein [Chloroflexota bacterium]
MSMPLWTVELHAHSWFSHDCLVKLDRIAELCQERGIDKIAITDHNTAKGALDAYRSYPMLVIPGEEIMTTEGELLGWFIREEVPPGLTPEETIQRLRRQNALIGVAHPFDRYRKGAWKRENLERIVDLIDVIEVFNSRCAHEEDNDQALAFAQAHGKLMTAGSDAHTEREYGTSVMKMAPFASNADGFKRSLADASYEAELSPLIVHLGSTYAKWAKRLVPSLRGSEAK